MTRIEYENTLFEVDEILKNIDDSLIKKIPENIRKQINLRKSKNYSFKYNSNKRLSEQNILDTTKKFLTALLLKFLCNEDEKKEILKAMSENE